MNDVDEPCRGCGHAWTLHIGAFNRDARDGLPCVCHGWTVTGPHSNHDCRCERFDGIGSQLDLFGTPA